MQSANRYVIDGANVLRAEGQADITVASTDLPVLPMVQSEATWQAGTNPVRDGALEIVAQVTKIADVDTTLKFAIMVAEDAAKTNAKEFAVFDAAQIGQVNAHFDQFAAKGQFPKATHWFVRALADNAVPANIAVNFSAFIAPVARR